MKRLIILLGVVSLLAGAAYLLTDVYRFLTLPLSSEEISLDYDLRPGTSFKKLAADLHDAKLVSKPLYWSLYARLQGQANSIKAGEYRLDNRLTPVELLDKLIEGKSLQYSLTIPEGWTYQEMMNAIARHPHIIQTLTDGDNVMARLGAEGMHPEGRFYPDTYYFPKGITDLDFLRRSYAAMQSRLQQEWGEREEGLPYQTPYEALIMASIVEKETGVAEERPMIAAVFVSRLKKGMLLQTDPTIIYGMGDSYKGDIRYKDLKRDTPYNTYIHKGLTPTPIALPGGDALHAALHPAKSNALYFVAKGDGSHHFSATYKEHRAAVIKYQLAGNAKRYKSQ